MKKSNSQLTSRLQIKKPTGSWDQLLAINQLTLTNEHHIKDQYQKKSKGKETELIKCTSFKLLNVIPYQTPTHTAPAIKTNWHRLANTHNFTQITHRNTHPQSPTNNNSPQQPHITRNKQIGLHTHPLQISDSKQVKRCNNPPSTHTHKQHLHKAIITWKPPQSRKQIILGIQNRLNTRNYWD